MDKIGIRIKKIRKKQQIKLTDLSKRVGVTVSCLSQIEKGKSFPSIVTLKQIAIELNSTVGDLIGENETLFQKPVVKCNERKIVKIDESDKELFLLSEHHEMKKMETYCFVLKENANSGNLMLKHGGEEFCYIISVSIDFKLNENIYQLEKGDCIYYNSNEDHFITNTHNGETKIIWIITPPNI